MNYFVITFLLMLFISAHRMYSFHSLGGNFLTNIVRVPSRLFSQQMTPFQRIERILANRGLGSRSDILISIQKGKVMINGKVVNSAAARYPIDIPVVVNGRLSEAPPLIAVYNKPIGILSTVGDPLNRPNLQTIQARHEYLLQMHPVGRLDADTSGLLLFSRDGQLTTHLLNPTVAVEREYEAIVTGYVNHEILQNTLASGVKTTDGVFPGKLLESIPFKTPEDSRYVQYLLQTYGESNNAIADVYREQTKRFALSNPSSLIPAVAASGSDRKEAGKQLYHLPYSYVRLVVTEGKYRMVRRILHNAGHSVCFLHRRRYGNICLQPTSTHQTTVSSSINILSAQYWPPRNTEELNTIRKCSAEELDWLYQCQKDAKK